MTDTASDSQLSSTQKGAIGEAMVAVALTAYSGGQLACFSPFADDDGIDILVYNKQSRLPLSLQIKTRLVTPLQIAGTVQFDLRQATWAENEAGYMVGILLEGVTIRQAWLVPLGKLPEIAGFRRGKFILTPSMSMNSRDRYSGYRLDSAEELTTEILKLTSGAVTAAA